LELAELLLEVIGFILEEMAETLQLKVTLHLLEAEVELLVDLLLLEDQVVRVVAEHQMAQPRQEDQEFLVRQDKVIMEEMDRLLHTLLAEAEEAQELQEAMELHLLVEQVVAEHRHLLLVHQLLMLEAAAEVHQEALEDQVVQAVEVQESLVTVLQLQEAAELILEAAAEVELVEALQILHLEVLAL
jgi:hypothetical protein